MKDLLRPTLALLLTMPLGLIGQTTPDADSSQVPKTYEELVNDIDNYYNEQFPEQANSPKGTGAVVVANDDYNEQFPEQANSLEDIEAVVVANDDYNEQFPEQANSLEDTEAVVVANDDFNEGELYICLLYTSPSPRDGLLSRMPSSA